MRVPGFLFLFHVTEVELAGEDPLDIGCGLRLREASQTRKKIHAAPDMKYEIRRSPSIFLFLRSLARISVRGQGRPKRVGTWSMKTRGNQCLGGSLVHLSAPSSGPLLRREFGASYDNSLRTPQ